METRKIAVACLVGGIIGVFVSLVIAPGFWILGLITGILAGGLVSYIAYDVREVLQKIPVAWGMAAKGCSNAGQEVVAWIKRPHPFLFLNLVVSMGLSYLMNLSVEQDRFEFFIVLSMTLFIFLGVFLVGIISHGIDLDKKKYRIRIWEFELGCEDDNLVEVVPATYKNVYAAVGRCLFWFLKGLVWFVFWGFWKFSVRFVWYLFKQIHSKKRLICMVDTGAGILLSWLVFIPRFPLSFGEQCLMIVFGGVMGAVLGVISFEVISKRVLKLAQA